MSDSKPAAAPRAPARPASAPSSSGATVTVASKLPNKFTIRRHVAETTMQPVLGGGMREVTVYRPCTGPGEEFVLNGTAVEFGLQRNWQMAHGFALTMGVPKDLWDAFVEQNKGAAVLENGLIFAHAKTVDTSAHAKENRAQRSGLEPLDPTKPFKVGKKGNTIVEISASTDSPKPLESELELAQTD